MRNAPDTNGHRGDNRVHRFASGRVVIVMKLIPIAISAAAVAVLAGCGSSATSSAPALPAAEQSAIASMSGHCTESPAALAAEIRATHGIEVKGGVTNESTVQLSENLAKVVRANKTPTSCAQDFGAYVTMRTGG